VANLTVTIDKDLLCSARIRAVQHGTTVNALVRDFLVRFTGDDGDRARKTIPAIAEGRQASSGEGGRTWTRDDVYDQWT
jgi:hypothetical protein